MKLKNGLYEQVINKILGENINSLSNQKLIDKEKIDEAESSTVLSRYLSGVIEKGLSFAGDDELKLNKQISICNKIMGQSLKRLMNPASPNI